jgi:tripartite-type tricarboxylate transporter receptor subunit TctC
MTLLRRRFLQLSAAATLTTLPRPAFAQAFPNRPLRFVVPFPPGGATDIIGRLLAQWLTERLGQTVVVENRPGAGSNLGTEAVVRAAPDGHTFLLVNAANAINATLYDKLSFNFIRDIAPVGSIARASLVLLVNPDFPARTVPEFIAYAKANPGKVLFASAGNGNSSHLAGEMFKSMTGIDIVHVPYRGGAPAIVDLLAGRVHAMFPDTLTAGEQLKAGRLRPIAVCTPFRSPALPDTPTIAEYVPGYDASSWWGIGVPRGTPDDVIARLNTEINAGLADPKLKERLTGMGALLLGGTPAEFGKLVADETEKWAKVVRSAGAKPD